MCTGTCQRIPVDVDDGRIRFDLLDAVLFEGVADQEEGGLHRISCRHGRHDAHFGRVEGRPQIVLLGVVLVELDPVEQMQRLEVQPV